MAAAVAAARSEPRRVQMRVDAAKVSTYYIVLVHWQAVTAFAGGDWPLESTKEAAWQVRRSMHQGCLLKPRNLFFAHFLPMFPHLSSIFSVWTPGIQGTRPEVPGKTGKNRGQSG